jgi:hypothetical protein
VVLRTTRDGPPAPGKSGDKSPHSKTFALLWRNFGKVLTIRVMLQI